MKWPSGLFIWILIILKISELRSQVRELGSARGRKMEFPWQERRERDVGNIVSLLAESLSLLRWSQNPKCCPGTAPLFLRPQTVCFWPLQACFPVFQLPASKKFAWSIFWWLFWCKFRWIEAPYLGFCLSDSIAGVYLLSWRGTILQVLLHKFYF